LRVVRQPTYVYHTSLPQILGFSTAGTPVLPNIPLSVDVDAIRRDKLGWDEISAQSAKIVSFSGKSIQYHSAYRIYTSIT